MSRSFLMTLIQRAEQFAACSDGAPTDGTLLGRFCRDRDEAAFATILARHGRLVWGVCRSLLPQDAEAEDAFQATFLAFVRGARSIRAAHGLAPWLHRTATRVSRKARLTAARRLSRETKAARREADTGNTPDWPSLQLVVHEEIDALPNALRSAFVLCVLDGRRHKDAATVLGVPVGTISARISRARDRLLARLAARGLAPGLAAAVLALDVASGPASVPDGLLMSVRTFLPDGIAMVPRTVVHLAMTATEGVTMKTKLLAAAVMIGGALVLAGGGAWMNRAEGQSPAKPASAEPPRTSLPLVESRPTESPLATPAPQAAAEYQVIPRPEAVELFRTRLAQLATEGWEYLGSEAFSERGQSVTYLVFKRIKRTVASATDTPLSKPGNASYDITKLRYTNAGDIATALQKHFAREVDQGQLRFVAEHASNSIIIMTGDVRVRNDVKRHIQELDAAPNKPPVDPLSRPAKPDPLSAAPPVRPIILDYYRTYQPSERTRTFDSIALQYAQADSASLAIRDYLAASHPSLPPVSIEVDSRTNSLNISGEFQAVSKVIQIIKDLDMSVGGRKPEPVKR